MAESGVFWDALLQLIAEGRVVPVRAALSGDQERLDKLMAGLARDTQVRFTTRATFQYRGGGTDYYRYEIFPVAGTLPSGANTLAFITYVANHPTFATN